MNERKKNTFNENYSRLNEDQKLAVDTLDGPVLVVAGPGSGKTQLLALRVANILQKTDTPASSILCLTFTDSAAVNMRKRLVEMIGGTAYEVSIHTFHSFGKEIINRYPEYFYKGALFSPADDLGKMQVMEEIFSALPHDNPLSSYHPEHGYTYLNDVIDKISELKKGGVSPDEFSRIVEENADFIFKASGILTEYFNTHKIGSKKDLPLIERLIDNIKNVEFKAVNRPDHIISLKEHILNTLGAAYDEALNVDGTKPFTLWKEENTKYNKKKERIFKDFENIDKHRALAKFYSDYQNLLAKKGLYDFDDMLLDVVKAFHENPDLKSNVQEKYLYMLVDEFQDTSGVQMRILNMLLDSPVHEGRPNILAVGDDDQSIYKFQGAKVQNILTFHKTFRNPEVIVLHKNYRSTQSILDLVSKIIRKGKDRLENLLGNVKKDLIAAKTELQNGQITAKIFDKDIHELAWVAEDINNKIKNGCRPGEIAVISRRHSILENAANVFGRYKIPLCYERKKNIFEQIHIRQIIKILEFLNSLIKNNKQQADDILPEILSFLFWGIERIDIWKISARAYEKRKPWLEVMLESDNEKISNIANFLITLGAGASDYSAEQILDFIVGNKPVNQYFSPFKNYYFSEEKLKQNPLEYFEFLYGLRAFMKALRSYKGTSTITLNDAVEFVDLHKKHKIGLNDTTVLDKEENLVRLITAHSAKGLEFENVYILHAQDEIWGRTFKAKKIGLPQNLPFENEKENEDDLLRLLYVALSRAKQNIFITNHMYKDNGRETMPLRFFDGMFGFNHQKSKHEDVEDARVLENISAHININSKDEKELIRSMLKEYKLSVTHLHNFLDIVNAGPASFFKRNILRFPEAPSVSNSYGIAMHKALELFYKEFKQTKTLPSESRLKEYYAHALTAQRLSRKDYINMLDKGNKQLGIFYNENTGNFNAGDEIEVDFRYQGVNLDGAMLTGKIDRIKRDLTTKEIEVFDYKTGKPLDDWRGKSDNEKIKAWKYAHQIAFYKLLIENSRDFKNYRVSSGGLLFLDAKEQDNKFLSHEITFQETEDLIKLIKAVYKRIVNLDLPEVSKYPRSFKGILEFAQDLIAE
ncbi:ATP-dependent helicase [Candidatus Peregrinibacteria bacterium]|nr:ATP-dependent helicase [Candidatus Peregrinibacteria bacterium]